MSSGVKISELTAASTFTGSEVLPVVQSSTTLKATAAQVSDYAAAATATLINKSISGMANTITNVSLSSAVTGTLPVGNGGTGITTYAAGDLLYATASTTLAKLAATATAFVLLSGTAPSWGKVALASAVSGTLPVASGGTGQTAFTAGNLLYASAATTVTGLATTASGKVLVSGAAPSWGLVDLSAAVTGTLAIVNGGTAATTTTGILTNLFGGSTGTGVVVRATSPTLVTPLLGTPTSGVLDNCTATTKTQVNNSTSLASTAYVDRVGVQQVVSTTVSSVATGTTTIPADDTIPQNTEGDQYMSLSITPKSATSKLIITVNWYGAINQAASIIVALFQDSTANALAVAAVSPPNAGYFTSVPLQYTMTSGTTSATTFKVRAGMQSAGTTTFNGAASARYFGGAYASSIVITEIGV